MKRQSLRLATMLMSALWASTAMAQPSALPAVTVETAATGSFTMTTRLPGRVAASNVAEVRPQVSGIIQERMFAEGTSVEAGQPLYRIEDEIYLADVAAARAAVAQAEASHNLAIIDANRAIELYRKGTGTEVARDTAVATRDAAEAALQAARARLSSAEVDLNRTTIRAPVSGVIGLARSTTGALVGAQQADSLATIRTLDPIYVDVTQSVNDLMRWSTAADTRAAMRAAEIQMLLPNGQTFKESGHVLAAEPQVEPTTGMVTLRITYPNPDYVLLPGLYVEVLMPQETVENAVLVPQSAVMRDAHGGASVWVVEDGKVAVRPVTISGSAGNQWITSGGLTDGDQIVTSGFQRAAPGGEVQIIPAEGAPAPTAGN